ENIKRAMNYYNVPLESNTPLDHYNDLQFALLCYGTNSEEVQKLTDKKEPKKVNEGKFEGVMTALWRKYQEKNGDMGKEALFFHSDICSDCHGTKLTEQSRRVTLIGRPITEVSMLDLDQLLEWIQDIRLQLMEEERASVDVYI